MHTCNDCSSFGLRFERQYRPEDFIEGDPASRVWIIGLNPAEDPDWVDPRDKSELINYFDNPNEVHRYFRAFKIVSEELFASLGEPTGTAHTDLVKCSSRSWPPKLVQTATLGAGRGTAFGASVGGSPRENIISNCSKYLAKQIENYAPDMIICNGSEVSAKIIELLPPPTDFVTNATNYVHVRPLTGKPITVVLSGFIGRIDNYAKRRLGAEIESLLLDRQLIHSNLGL